jgi:hypothetical protein
MMMMMTMMIIVIIKCFFPDMFGLLFNFHMGMSEKELFFIPIFVIGELMVTISHLIFGCSHHFRQTLFIII